MSFAITFLLMLFTATYWVLIGTYSISGLDALLKPKWAVPIKPTMLFFSRAVFPMSVLFLVVIFFRDAIFPWIHEVNLKAPFRAGYLTPSFFLFRGLIYLGAAAYFSKQIRLERKVNAALTLVIVLFLGSLASYDWILSVSKNFHSTIFGLLMIVNGCLVAYAFALTQLQEKDAEDFDQTLLQDLNNIHFAMIALWSYLTLMQYITVWSGNLPEEATYFKERFHTWLGGLAAFILVGQTLIPIPLLLFKKLKAKLSFTKTLAHWTLFIQLLHLVWLVGGTR